MWWLVPVGIGIGKLVYDYFSEQEIEARQRWESKSRDIKKTVEEHRRNIEVHIQEVRDSYNFKLLRDIHFSSFIVADSAYQLLDDARSSLDSMRRIIIKTKNEKNELLIKLKELKTKKEKIPVLENLKLLNEMRQSLFDDINKVKLQRDDLYNEVKRLNQQTNELKTFIRDRCGKEGIEWYKRLEERTRRKKIAEGK
jgi:uncharacterized membrane-anchored protein YhcB (DUF1043 family)